MLLSNLQPAAQKKYKSIIHSFCIILIIIFYKFK